MKEIDMPETNPFSNQTQVSKTPITNSTSFVNDEVTLDDDIKFAKLDKLKLKTGEVVRVGFVLVNEQGAPRLKQAEVFFDDVSRKSFKKPVDMGLATAVATKLDKLPTIKFGAIICVYNIDAYGQLQDQNYELKAFVFSSNKWPAIQGIHHEFPLSNHDLNIRCEEDKYQNHSFTPTQERLMDTFPHKEQIIAEATALHDTHLTKLLGMSLSDADIKKLVFDQESLTSTPQVSLSPFKQETPPLANQVSGGDLPKSQPTNSSNPFSNIAEGEDIAEGENELPF